MNRAAAALAVFLLSPDGSQPVANSRSTAAADRVLQLEDTLAIEDVGEIQVNPEGSVAVFTVAAADLPANRTRTRVMSVPVGGGAPSVLADLPDGVSHLRWSPDGTRLAFFGSKGGKTALWTFDVRQRLLTRVCDYDRGNGFIPEPGDWLAWSPDGERIAFAGTAEPSMAPPDPLVATRIRYKSRTTFSDNRRAHLFVVPAEGGTPLQLTTGRFDEHSIDWPVPGREIVFISNREPDPDAVHNYDIFAVDVSTRAIRQITATAGVEKKPRVSPDGRWIAYLATTRPVTTIDSVAEDAHVWLLPIAGGAAHELNRGLDRRALAVEWKADSTGVLFTAMDRGRTLVYAVSRDGGGSTPLLDQPVQMGPFSTAGNGTVVFGLTSATAPREVYALSAASTVPRQLTSLNTEVVRGWRLSTPERIPFKSDGVDVEGWFYPPINPQVLPAPMLLNIHGGPHGMFGYSFDPATQAYAARGYGVLAINPRGSSGYGQRFSDGSVGNWGGGDYRDLMAGVDHVLKSRSDVDAARLGVTGRSYGGFMTNWIITQTDRFRAAVAVASVANLISFYGTSLYQDLVHAEFSGQPWEGDNFSLLWKWSPLAHVGNVKTPTLFVHGEQDNDVHVTEPEAMYMALRRRGVDAAFARYPREGHGFREPKHRLDALRRTIEWMDHYVMRRRSESQ